MTRALADLIRQRRANDRQSMLDVSVCSNCHALLVDLIEIHPGIYCCSCRENSIREGLANPVQPDAPAARNPATDLHLIPGERLAQSHSSSRAGLEMRPSGPVEYGLGSCEHKSTVKLTAGVAPSSREAFVLCDIPAFLDRRKQ